MYQAALASELYEIEAGAPASQSSRGAESKPHRLSSPPPGGGQSASGAPSYLPIVRVILWMAFQRLRSAPRAPSSSRRAL